MTSDAENQLDLTSAGQGDPVPGPAEHETLVDLQAPQPQSVGVSPEGRSSWHEHAASPQRGSTAPDLSLDPQETIRLMVGIVQAGRDQQRSSEEIVNSLLRLSQGKKRLVFLRLDLFEIFKLNSKKLSGEARVQ